KMFQDRIHCIPAAGEDLKQIAQEWLTKLDGLIAGRTYIGGERMTLADILLFAFVDFFAGLRQPINPENARIVAWDARMKARPPADAYPAPPRIRLTARASRRAQSPPRPMPARSTHKLPYAHTLGGTRYVFPDLRTLLARATPFRSGDALAGLAANSA